MRRPTLLAALLVLLLAPSLAGAQSTARPAAGRWDAVRVGKWTLLAAAVGLGVYALDHSRAAERDYARLRSICSATPAECRVERGRYRSPAVERVYRDVLASDRRARVGIFGGQIALVGSIGLFIYDLNDGRGPADIPFPTSLGVGVGIQF